MKEMEGESVDLVVTSPPYPMIGMWDEQFSEQDPDIGGALDEGEGFRAFELMHQLLDGVWEEISRVTKPGAIVCINIGDATRTLGGEFRLYPNHSRVLSCFLNLGFSNLPGILWRKQTNAPNKFMGSGMLAPGAYVTLEHEHILIFRKGNKRLFPAQDDAWKRSESAFFWEERNAWFSDVWDFKGIRQNLENGKTRDRSGAFPFELAYRLINMFSINGDIVLDPFLGTGTTAMAAIASGRNSIGYDIEKNLAGAIAARCTNDLRTELNRHIRKRILNHLDFVELRKAQKGASAFRHKNVHYDFPVMTTQERKLIIHFLENIEMITGNHIRATYIREPVMDVDSFSKQGLFSAAS